MLSCVFNLRRIKKEEGLKSWSSLEVESEAELIGQSWMMQRLLMYYVFQMFLIGKVWEGGGV